ncbi:hypothetical protein BJX65DRAFT_261455 [Aspergillus insuetus]
MVPTTAGKGNETATPPSLCSACASPGHLTSQGQICGRDWRLAIDSSRCLTSGLPSSGEFSRGDIWPVYY